MLQTVPWFLLGSLWAVLFCEYRGFRRRTRLVAHIRTLERELMNVEDRLLSEQAYNDRVKAELVALLAARSSRGGKLAPMSRAEAAE